MAEMRRQHHLALDQRKHEAENHCRRHDRHDFPDGTDAEQQRSKRCHRGQHPECDRDQHVLRALNSACELPGAPPMGDIDALAHHHGIVHQHPQRQDEADDGDGIDGKAEPVNQEDGAEKGDGDAGGHPDRQMGPQKQGKQNQNQQQPLESTVNQGAQPVGDQHGLVVPERQLNAFRVP